jgi:ribose 5-phosphate isomerase B
MSTAPHVVIIGSDHGGWTTKQTIIAALAKKGYTILDLGGFEKNKPDDYPVFAARVAKEVVSDKTGATKGILICGTGTGMAMAANKIKGARAALAYDTYSAHMARHDNDANILTLRGRGFSPKKAARLALVFLSAPFSNIPRHKRRIAQVQRLDR